MIKGLWPGGTAANWKCRAEIEDRERNPLHDISHHYFAARSVAGSFGWSGNIGIAGFGMAILGSCITDAELRSTEKISEGEGFCCGCKLCVSVCAVGMFERDREMSVTRGGLPPRTTPGQ